MSEKRRVKSEKVKIPHFRAGFLAGAGGFHTPLRSVASLSCGQRPHFAKQKRQTLHPYTASQCRVLSTKPHTKNKKPMQRIGFLFLAGAGGFEPATHGFGVGL